MNAYNISIKQKNNQPYFLPVKSNYVLFMCQNNQKYLSKKIYLLHKTNHGQMGYFFFKINVFKRMKRWANLNDINNFSHMVNINLPGDILYYINQKFINDNIDLFEINGGLNNIIRLPNENPYKSKIDIGHYVNEMGEVVSEKKKYEDMLTEDIRNLDVWQKETVYLNDDVYRYKNKMPEWQTSMHKRHYDRTNEGLAHIESDRASLDNQIHGYNMAPIWAASESYKYQ